MRFHRSLLTFVALILFVVAAIMFFVSSSVDVALGLTALGLAAWVGAEAAL